jgi:hypothetical protein
VDGAEAVSVEAADSAVGAVASAGSAAECLAAAAPVEAGKERLYGSRFKS